jgi:hypothetical protein
LRLTSPPKAGIVAGTFFVSDIFSSFLSDPGLIKHPDPNSTVNS